MNEETFKKQIDPIPDHDYFYYVPADWSLGQNASCRAYINFSNQEDIFIFKDKFDGYVFVDTKGTEYSAVVEFSPFQGLPRNRSRKKDNKNNTIETDAHYLSFVEALNSEQNDPSKQEAKLEFSYQFKDDKKITKTPLLEYLANKKQEYRDERKRRTDDRKKKREEERQRKKSSVAKTIPAAIQEEESKILVDEDDIMVRTIKSRPLDRNRNNQKKDRDRGFENKQPKTADENRDNRKSQKDRQDKRQTERRKERDQRRNEGKERNQKDNNRESVQKDSKEPKENSKEPNSKVSLKKDDKSSEKTQEKEKPLQVSQSPSITIKDQHIKKEVKKYSEARKERRARVSGPPKSQSNQSHDTGATKSDKPKSSSEQISKIDNGEFSELNSNTKSRRETPEERARRESDERYARRIKNKDRPSIEIYRPGKLKPKKDDDSGCVDQGSDSPRRQSLNNDESVVKDFEFPKVISESSDTKLKVYEMSPDIPPFIPKTQKPNIVGKIEISESKIESSKNIGSTNDESNE